MKATLRFCVYGLALSLLVGCPSDTEATDGAVDTGTTTDLGQDAGAEDVGAGDVMDPPDQSGAEDAGATDDAPDAQGNPDDVPDSDTMESIDAVDLDVDSDAVEPDAVEPDVDLGDVDEGDVSDTTVEDIALPDDIDEGDTDPGDVDPSDVDPSDVGSDADVMDPPNPDAAFLLFINHPTTTKAVLTSEVGLTGAAPGAIIDHRAGSDLMLATEDDVMFGSIADLDDVAGVGQGTIDKLVAFSLNWSASPTDPLLVALNSDGITPIELQENAGISSTAAAGIIMYRAGDDLTVSTDDDRFFNARKEVDDISGVGPASMAALEAWAGIGTTEVLSTDTSANLVAVAFGAFGEALVVGTPVGGTPHVLWYTPFSEDATVGEDPYIFLPLEGVPEAMNAAAFAPQGDVAAIAGEANGIYVFDAFEKTFDFIEISDSGGFADVAFDPTGNIIFGASIDSGIKSLDLTVGLVSYVPTKDLPLGLLALSTGVSADVLGLAGAGGLAFIIDGNDPLHAQIPHPILTGEDIFELTPFTQANVGDGYIAAGSSGFAGLLISDIWTRAATRTLESVRGAAVSADGHVLLAGADGLLLRYVPATAEVAPITPAVSADLHAVGYSDDGTALIIGNNGVALRYTPPPAP